MGGSFDPIHIAHLIAADSVRETLLLDQVLFIPVAQQPLKLGKPVTPAEHRVAMVELAIRDNPYFGLSRIEVDRPGPSYTADTLRLLREQFDSGTSFWFIVGSDSFLTLPTWREPGAILSLARLAVVRRPGVILDLTSIEAQLPSIATRVDWVEAPLIDISATRLRQRVAEGKSLRYRVPEPVREYIETNGLYQSND
jgi:nicotinate-nucleotide adenylyltransferase